MQAFRRKVETHRLRRANEQRGQFVVRRAGKEKHHGESERGQAFEVFTAEFDSWWPRSHHIGKAPLKRAVIDGRVGGRCYNEQADGTDCEWGEITVWEPPRRFVMAWKISAQWQYEPDAKKSSEVEVRFTPEGDGRTRVDLEHRHFERMGADGSAMRKGVDFAGWMGLAAGAVRGAVGEERVTSANCAKFYFRLKIRWRRL